ncbi:MAG: LLM class flavin-dependent oxidoreductase [Chloroflexota bacterium]|nr:LLM class flavin-dependent oxidoreductase [Chloroflexota bacterium]
MTNSNKISLGWTLPNGPVSVERRATFVDDIERGLDLIRGRFEAVWMADHLEFGEVDMLEGWTGITYFARAYPELLFGHTVICQSFRNPALLAKMGATLQFLTGGRFVMGIGAGWHEPEYRAYGYDFPSPGVRLAQLEETVQIIKAMWSDKPANFEGQYFTIRDAHCEPQPDPAPPLMIGGRQPRMLRMIARHADWWDVSGIRIGLDAYRTAAGEMARACDEIGRDPATLRRSWLSLCICTPTEEEARARAIAEEFPAGAGFVGTPEQIVDQMRPFIELGVDHFEMACPDPRDLTTLELLCEKVLPALQS